MNWIKENKFLAGFFAVMIVGIAGLGFLLYSSWNSFSEASENYNRQAAELKRLQGLVPYPNEDNLQKTLEHKDAYVTAIAGLQKHLSTMEFASEPMEPAAYQDILRKSVSAAVDKANKNGVKLPDKFYEGLEVYQAAPPKDARAATALGRELKSIDLVVNTLLDNKIDAITSITRTQLPEESDKKPAAQPAGGKPLVRRHSFSIGFTAEQTRLRKSLNEIVNSKDQFLIIRMLRIKNENEKGPAREDASAPVPAPAAAPAPADAASPAQAVASNLKFVVGTEKLNAQAIIDVIDFAAPPTK